MTTISSLLFGQKAGASGATSSTRGEIAGLLVVFAAVILLFSLTTDRFLSRRRSRRSRSSFPNSAC